MIRRACLSAAALLPWLLAACATRGLPEGLYARLATSRGVIVVRLDLKEAPLTVANFVGLSEGALVGRHFYDGARFARVSSESVEAGDPEDGTGGPGWTIPDELRPDLRHDGPGIVSLVTVGSHTGGSRFVITKAAAPDLDGRYPIFGRVIRGQTVVDAIQPGDRIKRVRILRVGPEATAYRVEREAFTRLREATARSVLLGHYDRQDEVIAEYRKKWPGAIETSSGLLYQVLQQGEGKLPEYGARVKLRLVGKLLDGTVFQSSVGDTLEFSIGALIPGLEEALLDMRRGEKRRLLLPPDLGYGATGIPGLIPARSFLLFEVELVDFE